MSLLNHPKMPDPVIVMTGFRTSSTWFFSKLRRRDEFRCYYEVFHEQLDVLTIEKAIRDKPSAWRSRHPDGAAYQLEFAPLIDNGLGIPGFPVEEALGSRFVGRNGLDGPLDEDVRAYLDKLVSFAHSQGQIPVLSCTRMLGRSTGLRDSYSGLHIMLLRNLYRQWNSFSGQHRTGSDYFLHTLFASMSLADRVPYIGYLTSFFSEESRTSLNAWLEESNYDRVFCYFAAFHIYFMLHARRSADLVVDINALCNPATGHREEVESAIQSATGVTVDLSDARDSIDYPKYLISNAEECRRILQVMVEKACLLLDATEDERSFATKLQTDLWEEHECFSLYTKSAAEVIRSATEVIRSSDAARHQAESHVIALTQNLADAETKAGLLSEQSEKAQSEAEQLRLTLQNTQLELDEANRVLEAERDQLNSLRAERARLFENLDLDAGPKALRRVLPLARFLQKLFG